MINLKFFLRSFLRLRYEKIVQIYYRTIPSTQTNATIHNQTASSDTEVRVSPPKLGSSPVVNSSFSISSKFF